MNKNKFRLTLAAAIAGGALVACAGPTPSVAQAGDAAARQAGDVIVSPTGIATAWIPAGTFTMGSPDDETGRRDSESPQRQVTISEGFWMGVFPVTQQQWEQVMGNNPSHFHANPAAGETQERRPVETVSWYDALVFANRLSILEGLSPAYSIGGSTNPDDWGEVPRDFWDFSETWDAAEIVPGANGWRLPTEAQWEYAARAGTQAAFSNGASDWQDNASIDGIGWFIFNAGGMTREVGLKQPNPWGLYDIHGNVFEWVWDWWGAYPNLAETDPAGASSGSSRVYRGGGWRSPAQEARSANRGGNSPGYYGAGTGLRLVRP